MNSFYGNRRQITSRRNEEAQLGEKFSGTGTRKKEQQSEKVCLNLSSGWRCRSGVHPLLGAREIAAAAWFALQTWGATVSSTSTRNCEFKPHKRRRLQGLKMGGGMFPCLERRGWYTGALKLIWIGAAVLLVPKWGILPPGKTPPFSKSFLLTQSHPPQWKVSCILKHVFQLEDLPLAQPYVPFFFSGILAMKLPNLLQADGKQPSSKCVLLRVHKHVALLSACRSKNLHKVLQSFMFCSLGSVWSSGIWEWHLSDAYEHSAYLLT